LTFDFRRQTASTTHHPRGGIVQESRHQGVHLPSTSSVTSVTFGRTFRNPKVSSMEGRDSLGSEIADELDFIEPTRMIDEPT